MTVLAERPVVAAEHPEHHEGPTGLLKWMTSTDHKVIGMNYIVTSLVMFFFAGIMALVMRADLASPSGAILSLQQYNELFTMHGSLMLYLFAGPFAFGGLANYIVPLQVGAPDMAFPRLNALSYWLFLGGSITMMLSFIVTGGAAAFGWVAYAPLSEATFSPGSGPDLWILALALTGFSAIFTGVNLITTIFYLRAPGMTMFRMPIFT
ncbi:MAG TPA: cbb3-type cytochrome c oxidase subunit I, partial [Acidimicrobiales bacterium]|nr:cbb3-type cytochrome c oxidase subunit I [Acidimicrobiales bacterium]